jgi:hypothetical protein
LPYCRHNRGPMRGDRLPHGVEHLRRGPVATQQRRGSRTAGMIIVLAGSSRTEIPTGDVHAKIRHAPEPSLIFRGKGKNRGTRGARPNRSNLPGCRDNWYVGTCGVKSRKKTIFDLLTSLLSPSDGDPK